MFRILTSNLRLWQTIFLIAISVTLFQSCLCSVSVPIESDRVNFRPLKIQALGRTAQLGSLYDARTDRFIEFDVFDEQILTSSSDYIKTVPTVKTSTKTIIAGSYLDKTTLLNIDLNTAVNIQAGLLQVAGPASFITDQFPYENEIDYVTGYLFLRHKILEENLQIYYKGLQNLYNRDAIQSEVGATHFVTGITWGGSLAVTLTDKITENNTYTNIHNNLNRVLTKLKLTGQSANLSNVQTISNFEIVIKADIIGRDQEQQSQQTIRDVQELIHTFPKLNQLATNGKGVPLEFKLTPMSVLKKYLNLTTSSTEREHNSFPLNVGLELSFKRSYLNIVEEIAFFKPKIGAAIQQFRFQSNCIHPHRFNQILELQKIFLQTAVQLVEDFKQALVNVRSGLSPEGAMADILGNYSADSYSVENVKVKLVALDFEKHVEKAGFCSSLEESYSSTEYFGSSPAPDFISKLYQNYENRTTYILFIKSEFTQNDRLGYEGNLNIFLNSLYEPSNKLFIVDCDFNYTECTTVHHTLIRQVKSRTYSIDDVRMEIRSIDPCTGEKSNKIDLSACGTLVCSGNLTWNSSLGSRISGTPQKPINKSRTSSAQTTRIVGGIYAVPHEFPFQVIFLNMKSNTPSLICSGSIINENYILSAAHCFTDKYNEEYDTADWRVVAGDHNWRVKEGTEQTRRIEAVYIHPEYKPICEVNDIAIVKLSRPLEFNAHVQSATLPDADYEFKGEAIVSGWGRLRENGGFPDILKKVAVPMVPHEKCVQTYADEQVFISNKMLCAGHLNVGLRDACHGDSGGPLTAQLENGFSLLLGVVSNGIGCAQPKYPGVYMNVAKYIDWITDTLDEADELDYPECTHPDECRSLTATKKCRCREGFEKDHKDGNSCISSNNNGAILISSDNGIAKFSLDGRNKTDTLQEVISPGALDYIFESGTLFWNDHTDKKILKIPILGDDSDTSQIAIVVKDYANSYIRGLAVDWIYNHIYWTDVWKNEISVANLDGSMEKVVISGDGLHRPQSIVVNPLNGWMHWSDLAEDGNGRIERAGLDGSNREIIINSKYLQPSSLVLDFVQNRLFWTDSFQHSSIVSSNFDGSDQRWLFQGAHFGLTYEFTSITLFEGHVFWTDDEGKSIFKANKCIGNNLTELYTAHDSDFILAAHAYDESRKPHGDNKCDDRTDPCSHICFPSPELRNEAGSTTCACPNGRTLRADQLSCD